jgi:fatty acid desaturase
MFLERQLEPSLGEEFRDDVRKKLPVEILSPLTRLSPLRSTLAILQNVFALAAVMAFAIYFWSWWSALIAIVLIAPLQHGLFILAHESAHYRLYETRWLNELLGRLIGMVGGVSMCSYRVIHRLHHNYLYKPQDPDIALHGGYPRGKKYLIKKLLKDLTGQTAWKNYAYFFGNPAINLDTHVVQRPLDDTSPKLRLAALQDRWIVVAFHVLMPIVMIALGWGWYYLVLWVIPLLTLLQAVLRLRAIAEHGAVTDLSSPLTAARTNIATGWQRFFVFPHHVNYHLAHHLYPAVPHYYLPTLHAALQAHGILAHAEVRTFAQTLSIIFAEKQRASRAVSASS